MSSDIEAKNKMLREALESLVDMLADVERPAKKDPVHGPLVEHLGNQIGFGALMSSAEASWREMLKQRGDPVGGEHVAGPCRAVLEKRLKKAREALEATAS